MAAGALLFNAAGEMLIVKPTYRANWLIPGGVVEEGESPGAACVREAYEELGLDIRLGRLLCLEYQSAEPERTESLQFVFYGGVLGPKQVAAIKTPPDELSGHQFVARQEALAKLVPRLARRVYLALKALNSGSAIYAENGVEM